MTQMRRGIANQMTRALQVPARVRPDGGRRDAPREAPRARQEGVPGARGTPPQLHALRGQGHRRRAQAQPCLQRALDRQRPARQAPHQPRRRRRGPRRADRPRSSRTSTSSRSPASTARWPKSPPAPAPSKLRLDDLQGGTFTLDNTGWFGSNITMPIINVPEVAILTMENITKRPVVVETEDGDVIAIRPIMNMVVGDRPSRERRRPGGRVPQGRQGLAGVGLVRPADLVGRADHGPRPPDLRAAARRAPPHHRPDLPATVGGGDLAADATPSAATPTGSRRACRRARTTTTSSGCSAA